jgi:hypothetical protein
VIHVYGIVDELAALPEVAGVDDARLEQRRVGGLELVVSRSDDSGAVSREAVLRHAEVVEELMSRSRAVLPAQFGRAFGDDDELAVAVEAKAGELADGLRLVRGCVEFGLRVVGSAAEDNGPAASASGADYMHARLDQTKRQDRLVDELHEPLARLSRAAKLSRGSARSLVEAAYLVPAEKAAAFREAVLRLETERPELVVVCTGPWPPYSFAAGEEDLS